jgi:DNA ligase 4
MITRMAYEKIRSIKYYCQLAGPRCMNVERKYDGEYCQIHIYLKNPEACIQIFSSNGKDSTRDRIKLHRALRDSLTLDTADCKIKR